MTDAPPSNSEKFSELRRLIADQASFDTWANRLRGRQHALAVAVMVFVMAATAFAIAVMGPRLVREGLLLWFGEYAEGIVREARIERSGSFKGGDPKYRMLLQYEFQTGRGDRRIGMTERNDLRYLPNLQPGAPIGIYYSSTDPGRSVADYNLRTDVYALALFLPYLAVFGLLLPFVYLFRLSRWRLSKS